MNNIKIEPEIKFGGIYEIRIIDTPLASVALLLEHGKKRTIMHASTYIQRINKDVYINK